MSDDGKPQEEETYRKVDNRRSNTDRSTVEASDAQAEGPCPETTAPPSEVDAESPPEAVAEVDVYGILRFAVGLLIQSAWVDLGIQAPPGGETRINLPHAKVAVDALGDIMNRLAPDLDAAEKHEMEGVLANLRINYVQRS